MILFNDISSLIESKYTGLELSQNMSDRSNIIVNPKSDSYYNRTLLVNYKYSYVNWEKLSKNNKIISRIPLDIDNYELEPYDIDKEFNIDIETELNKDLVLNPYYFSRELVTDDIKLPKFILSTDLTSDNYLNVAGYLNKKIYNCDNNFKNLKYLHDKYKIIASFVRLEDGDMGFKNFKQFNSLDVPTMDLAFDDFCFVGPTVVPRTPNKRMNVKENYIVNKFKTYRITDAFRSYNLRFNTTDGFYLYEPLGRVVDERCFEEFQKANGFELCLYYLYYFCKKNHFNCISGDILIDPLQCLVYPDRRVSLQLTKFPIPNLQYNPRVFSMSIFGTNQFKYKTRDYLTF